MASGFTNRGKLKMLEVYLKNATAPAAFKVALVTDDTAPTADTNVFSELTEIDDGDGYTTGGMTVERSAVGWTTVSEDDTLDIGKAIAKDLTWTATGGPIPTTGKGASYAVLLDDAGAPGPNVIAYWDLDAARSVSIGQDLKLQASELDLTE